MSKFASPSLSRSQKIGQAATLSDRQSTSLAQSTVIDERFFETFKEKFEGMELLDNQEKVQAISTLVNVLKSEQKKQLHIVLQIGRAFCNTEDEFSQEEWKHLLKYTQELFGMSRHTACMYRNVARDIDSGRIPREICPTSFSTAYQLSTYTDKQLELAKEEGIITPDVSRRTLVAFKQKHLRPKKRNYSSAKKGKDRLKALTKERERLYKKLEKIEEQIAREKEEH
ncbi:hypothetical protein [Saccharibacter floricola]|uniref:Uncharacterized protein n=1 Tax=Saccharibacter floricola DSM 15669 TaxID=1123227 RepID=A0ABQ0P0C5_9PROT|nr:hypothetical protein [Saccharibacter floricola]GBQ08068.1 hypothetical protein AA15669_1646 [Saccharibacter floricola DSM 15669]